MHSPYKHIHSIQNHGSMYNSFEARRDWNFQIALICIILNIMTIQCLTTISTIRTIVTPNFNILALMVSEKLSWPDSGGKKEEEEEERKKEDGKKLEKQD